MVHALRFLAVCTLVLSLAALAAAEGVRPNNTPPAGFTAVFNGKDLAGWHGLVGDAKKRAAMTAEQLAAEQKKSDEQLAKHWRVDAGDVVNDGGGPYLCTDKKYRDFEMWVDWKIQPKGDSGIYLRGSPQVQIWDPFSTGGAKVGSGGLYNNQKNPSKPLVVADNPIGEWNTFHVRMIGEIVRVELNGKLVVDNVVMENYWDRTRPIYPADQIELQTHGGETRFRNIYIREIGDEEAARLLQGLGGDEGFRPVFNGKDLAGWQGSLDGYLVENGSLVCDAKKGGVLLTKEEFADFIARFEFKLAKGANNGLAIRAPQGFKSSIDGLEIQILDDTDGANAGLKPWQVHGSVYGIAGAQPGYLRPAGEWNFEEVAARGSVVTVKVNGTKVLEADLSKGEKAPDGRVHPGVKCAKGFIGFMGHGARVEFRNVRVKTLE
jgi:hypothetical protein